MNREVCCNCFTPIPNGCAVCPSCQFSFDSYNPDNYPFALSEGTILNGRYKTGRVLGQGGFGITYLAYDVKKSAVAAIKEYYPDNLVFRKSVQTVSAHAGTHAENFAYGKQRFLEEAKTMAEFRSNPNIVTVQSYFEENSTAYIVMDYIKGINLHKLRERCGGKLNWTELENVITPIMDALTVVHAKGVIHRDIAPDNILVEDNGTPKLLDFGAARYALGDKSRSLDVILRHGYAPREQYSRHGRQGTYTDVYSLGATIYYLITGRCLPDSIDRLERDDFILPSSLGADIPEKAEDALEKGISVQPEDRYQSMGEFKDALFGRRAVPVPPVNPIPTEERLAEKKVSKLNKKMLAILCAAVLIIGGCAAIPLILRQDTPANRTETKNPEMQTPEKELPFGIDELLAVHAESIALNNTHLTLIEGDSIHVVAEISPDNTTDKMVTWSSSDDSVAAVTDGKIEAKKTGTAVITAKTVNGKTAECSVTVTKQLIEASGISLDRDSVKLFPSDKTTLTATITPKNTTDKHVSWTSSNSAVASVDSNGIVSAIRAGSAVITAKTENGKSAACMLTVPGLTGITVKEKDISLEAGGTHKFEEISIIGYETDSLSAADKVVTLTSSNTNIVAVNGHSITAKNPGTATITFSTVNGITTTCKVTVKEVAVSGIALNKTNITLTVGDTVTLTATVSPANVSDKTVTWASSNSKAAFVTNGNVAAIGEGTTVITAKAGNKTAQCTVTVKAKEKYLAEGQCGANAYWTLSEEGVLTISGTGAMDYFNLNEVKTTAGTQSVSTAPWYADYKNIIKKVVIQEGIINISRYAFWYCSSLTSLTLPSSLIEIGNYAFYNCNITDIDFPDKLQYIGESAFSFNDFTTITIPSTITEIDYEVFRSCTKLKTVNLPSTITSIGKYAFYGCNSLVSINLPSSLKTIDDYAFEYCAFSSLIIPSSVSSIGKAAFIGCDNLQEIRIPESVTIMGGLVFRNWDKTQTIYIDRAKPAYAWDSDWNLDCNAKIIWKKG